MRKGCDGGEKRATTSLPAVDRPNADRWNAPRSCQFWNFPSGFGHIIYVNVRGKICRCLYCLYVRHWVLINCSLETVFNCALHIWYSLRKNQHWPYYVFGIRGTEKMRAASKLILIPNSYFFHSPHSYRVSHNIVPTCVLLISRPPKHLEISYWTFLI